MVCLKELQLQLQGQHKWRRLLHTCIQHGSVMGKPTACRGGLCNCNMGGCVTGSIHTKHLATMCPRHPPLRGLWLDTCATAVQRPHTRHYWLACARASAYQPGHLGLMAASQKPGLRKHELP